MDFLSEINLMKMIMMMIMWL